MIFTAWTSTPPTTARTRAGLRWRSGTPRAWLAVRRMARLGINAPLTSSAGRLFDAVAALLGVRDEVSYEGQAAIELEQLADPAQTAAYEVTVAPTPGEAVLVHGADLVRAVLDDLRSGRPRELVGARFHNAVSSAIVRTCDLLREVTGLGTVALSGGVFQNVLLLDRCSDGLHTAGFRVLVYHRVPPNDGGTSLGQAAVVAAQDRAAASIRFRLYKYSMVSSARARVRCARRPGATPDPRTARRR